MHENQSNEEILTLALGNQRYQSIGASRGRTVERDSCHWSQKSEGEQISPLKPLFYFQSMCGDICIHDMSSFSINPHS